MRAAHFEWAGQRTVCTFESSNGAADVCDVCGFPRHGVYGGGSTRVDGAARAKDAADAKIVPDKASGSGHNHFHV